MIFFLALAGIIIAVLGVVRFLGVSRDWIAIPGAILSILVGIAAVIALAYGIDTYGTDQSYRPYSGVVEELHTRIVKYGFGSREEVIIEYAGGYLVCEDAYCFTLEVGDPFDLECRDDYDEDVLMCRRN